ncbi:hypothetical protein AVEN_168787-1 [Araneus ventricosus]|uniref:DDE-1 domain-containing protein n=1 Tax=Araneus ventricosus TaxID=182803 RepID=A0A4Y2K742_ARAVE|nr:hypothetical protein AVEN_168787-1 [Araneus ventricosus]
MFRRKEKKTKIPNFVMCQHDWHGKHKMIVFGKSKSPRGGFSNQTNDNDFDDEDAILADLKEKWKTLEGNGRITDDATLSDILEVDAELLTASYPIDEKILKSLMDNNKGQENDSYSENEDVIQPKPHRTEMRQSFKTIKRGFQMEENAPDSIFSSLIKCENFYENNGIFQVK